jgi:hypothetical protein
MSNDKEPDWSPEAVLKRLEAEASGPGHPVSAQLFLQESVAPEALRDVVARALAAIANHQGLDPGAISLGKPRMLSNSITATAPVEALRALMKLDEFKALLPANLSLEEASVRPVAGVLPLVSKSSD